jgi:ATP synthase in type III secretion protein N
MSLSAFSEFDEAPELEGSGLNLNANLTDRMDQHLRQTLQMLHKTRTVSQRGRVVQAFGTMLRVTGIQARIGQQCNVVDPHNGSTVSAEVVGFADGHVLLVPLSPLHGVSLDAEVEVLGQGSSVMFGRGLMGRVLNSFGQPLDGKPLPPNLTLQPLHSEAPNPMSRPPIDAVFTTGVRACWLSKPRLM